MAKSTAPKVRRRSPGEGTVYPTAARAGAARSRGPTPTARATGGRHWPHGRGGPRQARDCAAICAACSPRPAGVTVGEYLTGWIERHRVPSTWLTAESVRPRLPDPGARAPPAGPPVRRRRRDGPRIVGCDGRPALAGDKRPRRPVSALTARHVRAVLRRALSDAQRAALSDGTSPRTRRRRTSSTADHLPQGARPWRLLEATADNELGPLYAVAVTTGLRRGELLGRRGRTSRLFAAPWAA